MTTHECWDCKQPFEVEASTPTKWAASSFEGEDVLVYCCPYCAAIQDVQYQYQLWHKYRGERDEREK